MRASICAMQASFEPVKGGAGGGKSEGECNGSGSGDAKCVSGGKQGV